MPTSKEPEPGSIYTALMNAQGEMGPVLKNATNPHLKSKYADLGSVIETITEPLHKNGLVFTQLIQSSPDGAELVTMLILLGPAIEDAAVGKDVYRASVTRVALFVAVSLYAWATVWMLERWRASRSQTLVFKRA